MLTQTLVESARVQAMQSERLAPAALAALQTEKLRALVRHAIAQSPFYARHYAGINPDSFALTDLPIVTKPQIQAAFDEVVTDRRLTRVGVADFVQSRNPGSPWHLGAFAVMLSSGTSGVRGYYVLDGEGLADVIAIGYRQSNRPGQGPPGPPPPQRIAAVMLIEPFDSAGLLMRLIPDWVGTKLLLDLREDFAVICQRLNEFQPTLLSSFPYMLRLLCAASKDGRLKIQPKRITSSGDVLTDSDRRLVRETLGVEPHDYYCSTEASYIAWECDVHDGLHINADYVLIESVDKESRPVADGKLGDRLLLTNLSNRAMPLIRYEMSDQVTLDPRPCSCGCLLPRIRKVAGRIEHVLNLPGKSAGERVPLIPEHIDDFVGNIADLACYQVIQEEADRLTINVVLAAHVNRESAESAVRNAMLECFRRYGVVETIRMEVRFGDRLEPIRAGSEKVCHYWNRSGV